MAETSPPTLSAHHPHAKLWLAVTAGVIVLAALVTWYFVALSQKAATPTQQNAPAALSSPSPTPTTDPSDTSVNAVASDIKSIDTGELKSAVADLKAAVAQFKQ